MTYSATLHPILCTTRDTEALLLAFVSSFNALIADPSGLSAAEITDLDWYGDGVVGYDDRDYWLDWIIGRDWAITERLPFADATPTTKTESDPLGLFTGQTNVIVVDPLNSAAIYVDHASLNPCYATAARTGGSTTLFDSSAPTGQYRAANTIWGDALSMVGDSGNSNRWRFPKDGAEVAVYFRGGDYELDRSLSFIKEDAAATNNTRIIIRNYPGEVVNLYCGNASGTNTYIFTVSRPDMKFHFPLVSGRRGSVGSYVFAPFLFNFTNAGDRGRLSGRIANCRAIAPTHPDDETLPQYVDSLFLLRGIAGGDPQLTSKLLEYTAVAIGIGNDATDLRDLVVHPADDDFPRSLSSPGGATEASFGHTIDISAATNTMVRNVTISGTSSHSAIRIYNSGASFASGVTIQDCDLRNPENTIILATMGTGCVIQRNRIHDFASRTDAQDGSGIQISAGTGTIVQDNVIWSDDDQANGQTYGIDIGVDQGDSSMSFTSAIIRRNILYRCGMSYGYGSSPPATDLGRVHDNSVSRNIIHGLSDYSHTVPDYDGPITTNLGPHSATMYATVFDGNLIYRTDGDAAMIVERLPVTVLNPTGAPTDWPNVAVAPWFTNPANADPEFEAAATGDFTMRNSSPGFALMDSETPLIDTDLDVDPYDCTITPQYLPRMDVYSGRVIKNLSAVPVLLLSLLLSAASAEASQGGCERGRDSRDAGRFGDVDRGEFLIVNNIAFPVFVDRREVIKLSRFDVERFKRNDGGKCRAVDCVRAFHRLANHVDAADKIVDVISNTDSSGGRCDIDRVANVNQRIPSRIEWNFPGNHPQRQFRRPVKLNAKKDIIGRGAVDRVQADNLQLVGRIADVGNHPGRQRSEKRTREKNDGKKTSHGINPLG